MNDQDKKVTSEIKSRKMNKPEVPNFHLLIPELVRGMKKLDRTAFKVEVAVPAIQCKARSCGRFQSAFKSILLNRPRFRSIIPDPSCGESNRLILLNPTISSPSHLTEQQKKILENENGEFKTYTISLTYTDFSVDQILQKVLPIETDEIVSSFETIGHIAHLNLKFDLLAYKYIIGKFSHLFLQISCIQSSQKNYFI